MFSQIKELSVERDLQRQLMRKRDFIAFGSGSSALLFAAEAADWGSRIIYFADNDPKRQGSRLNGIEILAPARLLEFPDTPIVVCSHAWIEIVLQLHAMGLKRNVFVFRDSIPWDFHRLSARAIHCYWEEIEAVYQNLADEPSRIAFESVLRCRLTMDADYLVAPGFEQYVHPLVRATEGDIVADVGGFDGYTAILFAEAVKPAGRVYSFEPEPHNLGVMQEAIRKQGLESLITICPKGAWSSNGQTALATTNRESWNFFVEPGGDTKIEVVTLDSYFEAQKTFPNLIKIDVEGGELEVLRGARQLIAKHKPKLQISLYHKAPDLWRLPSWVLACRPDYRIYCANHYNYAPDQVEHEELVLYAI